MARRRILAMQIEKASLWVHHTSISCILSQYFEISKNLNFHNFLEKSAFFAIFADICSKTAKKFPTGNFFLKIRSDLKCVGITPNCSKKVVRTLRESLRLALRAHGCQRALEAIWGKLTACECQKVVKVTILLQKT